MIVDWATGLELSAPTSALATMARAARDGILLKSGHAVECLAGADAVVFDKTGVLMHGRPEVAEVISLDPGLPADELLALAAAAEQALPRHPIAAAIVRYARTHGITIPRPARDEYVPRLGMLATVEGARCAWGARASWPRRGWPWRTRRRQRWPRKGIPSSTWAWTPRWAA